MKRKIFFIIMIIMICITTTGCMKEKIENRKITNNAIDYFVQKYNIKRKDIEIKYNNLYGNETSCFFSCGDNTITIIYNTKEYIIRYDLESDSFGDNYQYEEIYNNFYQYLISNFPFATSIKIDMLESDVLATPTKYTDNIENYIKNTIIRTAAGNTFYTHVKIWIEATDEVQAKELHEKHHKTIITKLENLQVSYNIGFSKNEGDTGYYNAFYYYSVSSGGSPSFEFTDKVDNNRKRCNRSSIKFDDNILICN